MKFLSFDSAFSLYFLSLTSFLWSGLVNAQADPYNPSPFSSIGYLDAAHCDDPTNLLSGGWFSVNGHKVIVPKNMLITLPAITIAWCELFQSGSSDTPNLPLWGTKPYEISVTANRVSGQILAGLIYIAPEFFGGANGFINYIDYATGEFRVGGTIGDKNTGQRVRINDPVGRYGKPYTAWPLMASDPDSPSIKASTGFPVCIPRSDPATEDDGLCPKKNRPVTGGVPRSIFTFPPPPVAAGSPDPELPAPLLVGDYITYSGAWVSSDLVAIYELDANLGIFTAPGTKPSYISVEDARWGIIGNPGGEIAETRVVGYTTDPSTSLTVYALDVDPCTGVETERTLAVVVPRPNGRLGQWRYRTDTDVGPATREVLVKSSNGQMETKSGIVAGQYVQPIMDDAFIFPELDNFGAPMFQFDFDVIPFIAQGGGPFTGGVPGAAAKDPVIVGQLNPWPGVPKPNAPNCPPPSTDPPTDPTSPSPKANAGPDQKVLVGAQVTLSGSSDTTGIAAGDLAFSWAQTEGPTVTITGSGTKKPTFTAPTTFPGTATSVAMIFELTVDCIATATTCTGSSNDTVTITVTKQGPDIISLVSSSYKNSKGAGILVVRARSSVTDGTSVLSMRTVNPNTPVTRMNTLGNGVFELQINIKPRPNSVIITSSLGQTFTFAPN